jgi:plastocyanin
MKVSSRGAVAAATPVAGAGASKVKRRTPAALCCCAIALVVLVASAAAAGGPGSLGPRSAITARVYVPAEITVAAGQTISWHNETLGPHTVTSTTELFNSGRLDSDTTYSLRFENPGTFDYYCTVHPTMRGVVTVLAIPPERVVLHVRRRHTAHGAAATVRAQVARSGVQALLQVTPAGARSFKTLARARLGAQGTATFALGAAGKRRIRVVVPAAYGQPRLISRAVALPG